MLKDIGVFLCREFDGGMSFALCLRSAQRARRARTCGLACNPLDLICGYTHPQAHRQAFNSKALMQKCIGVFLCFEFGGGCLFSLRLLRSKAFQAILRRLNSIRGI